MNGLTEALLLHNPNKANPSRLSPQQAVTCDMDHNYTPEQEAFDGGLMDKFVEYTSAYPGQRDCDSNGVMAYFDGNTVTALWNYAQNFAMSDNSFDTTFGPSTPGALNLIAGNTHGATPEDLKARDEVISVQGTVIGDADPQFDDCSSPKGGLLAMSGRNVGDLLECEGHHLGLVPGRIPADGEQGRQGGVRREVDEPGGEGSAGLQPAP